MMSSILLLVASLPKILAAGLVAVGALGAAAGALAGLFLLIPGEQPEKFLFGLSKRLKSISKK